MSIVGAHVEIDQGAIAANLRSIRQHLTGSPGPEVCVVMKADAYGHGLELVLPLVLAEGFTTVGIASTEEARRARELGFAGRLLRVRAAAPSEVSEGVGLGIEEWVGGFLHARAIAEIAVAARVEIPVHLALNSAGLSKECLDWRGGGGASELEAMLALRGLTVRGICTHFPSEEAASTRVGLDRFREEAARVVSLLGADRSAGVQLHCATSYAAFTVPESRLDLVRIGAAVYGDTSAAVDWQRRAMRVTAPVSTVNVYPAGSVIGYAGSPRLQHDSVIATLPVGYGDGIPRAIGGRGNVLVRGKLAPIVDHFAMNSMAVDVTAIAGVLPGDEAVLYGWQGAAEIGGPSFESQAGMIAAAAYTSWGQILPRIVRQAKPSSGNAG